MRKLLLIVLLILGCSLAAHAQTLDIYYGNTSVVCPSPTNVQSATITQTGTTITATVVTNGAVYGFDEPIIISGTGSGGIDTVDNPMTSAAGTALITNVSGNVITATSPNSVSFSGTGSIAPARYYSAIVTDAFGTRKSLCTPRHHEFFMQAMSSACASIIPNTDGICGTTFAEAAGGVSRTSNVVTFVTSGTNSHLTQGEPVNVTGCSDVSFNGAVQLTGLPTTTSVTYASVGTNASGITGCTMAGNGWAPPASPAKYPTGVCTAAQEMANQYSSEGWTATGDDSVGNFNPFTCAAINAYLPFFTNITTPAPSRYAADNLNGCAPQPLHTPSYTIDRTITGLGAAGNVELMDWFDPNYQVHFTCYWSPTNTNNSNNLPLSRSPFDVGQAVDDSDSMGETRGNGSFHSVPIGKNAQLPGLVIAFVAPQISLGDKLIYGLNTPTLFPVNTVLSKHLSTSAPASCTDAAPCSWPDFVRNKYTTVAAMNTAWGSTYTTFASSQSTFTGETVTTPAGYTFAHTGVTPRSVQVFLTPSGGSAFMVTGDCANGAFDCPTGTAGAAQFLAPHVFLTNNYYAVGTAVLDSNGDIEEVTSQTATPGKSGSVAPTWPATTSCSGTQTTVSNQDTLTCISPNITGTMTYSTGASAFTIGGAGSLPAGEVLSVSYTTGGWSVGGTGLEDEDGGSSWVSTNGVCPGIIPPWSSGLVVTAYHTVVTVVVGTANSWQMAVTSGTTSGSAPAWSATAGTQVTGSDGIPWQSLAAPVSDAANGDFKVACGANASGGTGSSQWAADVTAWTEQYLSIYFKTNNTEAKQLWPDLLNFGTNFSNMDWGNATWEQVLKAEDLYTDVGFWGEFANGSQGATLDGNVALKQSFSMTYFTHPIVAEEFEGTSSGWEANLNCTNTAINCWPGLVARAQGFYSQVNDMLNFKNPSGVLQYSGVTWWTDHTAAAVLNGSFGMKTNSDNRLNGVENVTASVPCSAPLAALNCGGEFSGSPWVGVNAEVNSGATPCVHCLIDALALWKAGTAPPTFPIAPSIKSIIWGLDRAPIENPVDVKGVGFEGDGTRGLNLFGGGTDAEPFHAVQIGRLQSELAFDESLESHGGQKLPTPIGRTSREGYDRSGPSDTRHLFKVGSEATKIRKVLKHAVGQHKVSGLVRNATEPAFVRQTEFDIAEGLLFGDVKHLAGQIECRDAFKFFRDCARDPANSAADFNGGAAWRDSGYALDAVPYRQAGLPEVVQVAPVVRAVR